MDCPPRPPVGPVAQADALASSPAQIAARAARESGDRWTARARGGWGCGPAAHAGVVGAFGTDFAAMLAGAVCTVELATLLRSSAQTATVSQRWKHARCPCVQAAPTALLGDIEAAPGTHRPPADAVERLCGFWPPKKEARHLISH